METCILEKLCRDSFSFNRLAEEYPALLALKDVPQDPAYHAEGDVFCHTEMVCRKLTKLAPWQNLPDEQQALMFLAAAFHDIGKPACTKIEDGKWVSPKHTIVGEKVFRRMAYQDAKCFGLTFEQREFVSKLIRYHGLPVWFWAKQQPELDLFKAAESIPLVLLYLLSKADVLGRIQTTPSQLPDQVEWFAEYAKELNLWEAPYTFANSHTKFQFFQKGSLWQGAELYDDTEFDVILMSGLPLSGKDTWIAANGGNLPVISLDDLREKMDISPTQDSGRVVHAATEQARVYLRKKQPFIWNATNIIQETRQRLVNLFAGYGARVHILYLEAPYQELLDRNLTRSRHIPENVLEGMIRKLEIPAPWEAHEVRIIL